MNEGKPYTIGALARLVKGTGYFFWRAITMKMRRYYLSFLFGAVAVVGLIGCGQEAPKTSTPSAPAVPSKSVTDSTGQAVVDSIKAPLDKSRQVENTLEKAAGKTADTVKDATQ